jgi:hypothetical protein
MTKEEILENLCYNDDRNPITAGIDEDVKPRNNCFCCNCFYGRDKLALEILKLKGE